MVASANSDHSMILIPVMLLAAFPPGVLFPQMATGKASSQDDGGKAKTDAKEQSRSGENPEPKPTEKGGSGNGHGSL